MSAADWAARYCERFGFALAPSRGKRPMAGKGWNDEANLLRDPGEARRYFERHPQAGMGVCLEPSGLCSLDLDHLEHSRTVLAPEGIDVDALIRDYPTIVGRAPRVLFKAPAEVTALRHHPLQWPAERPIRPHDKLCVLELRAGRIKDMLPPSVHPDTGRPYRWLTAPRDGFAPPPDALLRLWRNFEAFRHRARNLCPWAPPEPEPALNNADRRYLKQRTGPSVIAAFNQAHDVSALLEAHGYKQQGRNRWKSPDCQGQAGVVLLGERIYCHHAGDPLGDGKPHDAFDLYAVFEHGGDVRAAVRAAAEALGMNAQGQAR